MTTLVRILRYSLALSFIVGFTGATALATAGSLGGSARCASGAAGHRCVFLAPFDHAAAAEEAVYRVDVRFGLLNYIAKRATCRPQRPDRDRLGRRGWNRVSCAIDLSGATGGNCAIERDGVSMEPAPCTGTIWQLDGDSGAVIHDIHARRARFEVILLKHPTECSIVARITQLPPFAPRLARR